MKTMSLLQDWRDYAYAKDMNGREGQLFWANYFNKEKEVYKVLLANADKVYEGTVASLAKEFDVELSLMVGFLDGINDSLVAQNPIEEMDQDTKVSLAFDREKLYKNMVEAQADWLYELEEWDALLAPERRKELYREQKNSSTVIKDKKVGRNDPCPCGSGKKYKKCCGVNA
jgi:preprotein translocase subunit SecA